MCKIVQLNCVEVSLKVFLFFEASSSIEEVNDDGDFLTAVILGRNSLVC